MNPLANPGTGAEQQQALLDLAARYASEFENATPGTGHRNYGIDYTGGMNADLAPYGLNGQQQQWFRQLVDQYIDQPSNRPAAADDASNAAQSATSAPTTLGGPDSELNDGTGPILGQNFQHARMPFYEVIDPKGESFEWRQIARASTEGINRMPGVFDAYYAVPETNKKSGEFFYSGPAGDLVPKKDKANG